MRTTARSLREPVVSSKGDATSEAKRLAFSGVVRRESVVRGPRTRCPALRPAFRIALVATRLCCALARRGVFARSTLSTVRAHDRSCGRNRTTTSSPVTCLAEGNRSVASTGTSLGMKPVRLGRRGIARTARKVDAARPTHRAQVSQEVWAVRNLPRESLRIGKPRAHSRLPSSAAPHVDRATGEIDRRDRRKKIVEDRSHRRAISERSHPPVNSFDGRRSGSTRAPSRSRA